MKKNKMTKNPNVLRRKLKVSHSKGQLKLKHQWEVNGGMIYLFWAESQYILTMSFLRIQEFYESSLIIVRGKKFDMEQYMDLYAEKYGNFSYTEDWCGFNVPDVEFAKFYKMYNLGELSRKETALLKIIGPAVKEYYLSKNRFCVIGAYRRQDIAHEVAHGLYNLDPEYKKVMIKLINSWKKSSRFGKMIFDMGYSKQQFLDECQAYMSTSTKSFLKDMGYWGDWKIVDKFKKVFVLYKKKWGITF